MTWGHSPRMRRACRSDQWCTRSLEILGRDLERSCAESGGPGSCAQIGGGFCGGTQGIENGANLSRIPQPQMAAQGGNWEGIFNPKSKHNPLAETRVVGWFGAFLLCWRRRETCPPVLAAWGPLQAERQIHANQPEIPCREEAENKFAIRNAIHLPCQS